MIRKNGNRFSPGQTRSVRLAIMLKQRDEIMIRLHRIMIQRRQAAGGSGANVLAN
jgi:hypothetical protein